MVQQNSRYPYHLAKLVAQRLTHTGGLPADGVLMRLFEVMYFASLKTDETRPCRCTVNYIDPDLVKEKVELGSSWTVVEFHERIPLEIRSLLKLGDAADPTVSSLAVFSDAEGQLFIWGLVDQELRYGDYVALDGSRDPNRPGLFQATITGLGGVSVYKDFALIGCLEQDSLVTEYHDVLWDGPVYQCLKDNLNSILFDKKTCEIEESLLPLVELVQDELLVRWQNVICRVLFNIQQYGHGGGLLIVPRCPAKNVNVKYQHRYDRLPRALFRLAENQILKRQAAQQIADSCQTPTDLLACGIHFDALQHQLRLNDLKRELLGCIRFVASLSRVDGFVLLDKSLVVHGFGVETRAAPELAEACIAGDAAASIGKLRRVPLSQYGTRHRAMMRYCAATKGALGFVVSQDGDIRATLMDRNQLVLWENINVQLAYRAENQGHSTDFSAPVLQDMFRKWTKSVECVRATT